MDDLLVRIEAACGRPGPSRALREELLRLLQLRVPFDAYVFLLTDPATIVGTSPHASIPMLPRARLPDLIRRRYLTTRNRHDALPAGQATSLRSASEPGETPWQEALQEIGITDQATVSFKDRYGCWGFLDLWRAGSEFAEDELGFLSRSASAITAGLRASQARTFTADRGDAPVGPAVLVLDADLQVRSQTDAAATALLQLLPTDEPIPPIPAVAYNVAAALLASEQGIPIGPAWSRVHLGGSDWVTARASRLGDAIAVTIEPSTSEERLDLIARAHGLSERETSVLELIAAGFDSKRIAKQLVVSEHTAVDHVKAVLNKTRAPTRQVLLARVIGRAEAKL